MKPFLSIFLLLALNLHALTLDIKSFSTDFIQTITDEHNKTITYTGTLDALEPNFALWHYISPVQKSIYINKNRVIIIEPELEQAIIKQIDTNIDILSLLKNATEVSKNRYTTHYNHQEYTIIFSNNDTPEAITYNDTFDNKVKITFNGFKPNSALNKNIFIPKIPKEYDVIR